MNFVLLFVDKFFVNFSKKEKKNFKKKPLFRGEVWDTMFVISEHTDTRQSQWINSNYPFI